MPWSPTSKKESNNAVDKHEFESKYGSLAAGVSVSGELCHSCGGGSSKEKTLSVTRTAAGALFKCHRASCGVSGVVSFFGAAPRQPAEQQSTKRTGRQRYNSLAKEILLDDVKEYLLRRYGITDNLCAKGLLRWTEQHSPQGHGRLVMPILDHQGYPYGYVARKLNNQVGAKSFMFVENNEGCWYLNRSSQNLLIVEDQLSALKASQYVNSLALLGTNITEQTLTAIKAGRYTTIYLALDRDAFPKSVRLAVELRPQVAMSLIRLQKDVKDMSTDEILDMFLREGVVDKDPR